MRIGFIDWTEDELHFYIFEKKGGQHILEDTMSIPLEGELNHDTLSSLVKKRTEHIYLSVPVNTLSLRELRFPFFDKNKIRDTISYELEGILLGSISGYTIDHIVTETFENGCKVLAVCMEKTGLEKIINTLSLIGLEPEIITSTDLRLSNGKMEKLLEKPTFGREIRVEAARKELVNPSINLRQEELAYKGHIERLKKTLRLTAALALLLLLIFGINTTLNLISLKKEYSLLTNEIHEVYRDTFPEEPKIVDPVRQFKGNLNMLMRKKAAFVGIPVLDILLNMAKLKDKDITLYEFKAGEEKILIKGTAASFEDVESFKNSLASLFENVKVTDSNATSDKKIRFTIVMREQTI